MLEAEAQLAELAGLLDGLGSAGGRVVLVRGEAGIGKSALIAQFASDAADRCRMYLGACDDLGTPQPLAPVWDVARKAPSVAAALSNGDRRGVMDALLDLLSSPSLPTVLVFEDTQWADEATLDVITFLGRRIAPANGLLVLTYRDGEVDAGHPLRQVLGELPAGNLVRIRPASLSLGAITTLVGERPLAPREVLELTDGNPLFVREVIATGSTHVPTSLQDAVLARVGKLSPGARSVAELVSIVPGTAESWLVEEIAHPTAGELRECERQGLLQSDGERLSFCHELQRRAVESALPPDVRRERHQQVLARLRGRADVARLVHHARWADDLEELVILAPRAAAMALEAGSHREALAHFRVLGPHLDRLPMPDAADVAEDWARSELHFDYPAALDVLPRAVSLRRAAGDGPALARTLAFGIRVHEVNGQPGRADACATEAIELLERLPPGEELAYALTERAWLHLVRGDDDRAGIAIAERAIHVADQVGDERAGVRAMLLMGAMLHNEQDPRGVSLIEEAHRNAARAGHHVEETYALINLAGIAGDGRDLARASDLVERARSTAARHELRPLEVYARAMGSEFLLWSGDWTRAEDEATEVLGTQPDTERIAWRILAIIAARRGRTGSGATIERMWSLAQETEELQIVDPAASVMAESLWLTREEDQDRLAPLEQVLQRGLQSGIVWPSGAFAFWMWKLGVLTDVPAHLPDCYRWIMTGEPDRAVAFWAARDMHYEQALALMHGTDDEAIQALRIFEALGADGSARRLRAALREERGLRVPRGRSQSSRDNVAGLTARQAEVLELLAEGLTNMVIADRLFVSHRTVENHVATILMKLDVPGREAAVCKAREQGLLDTGESPR